MSDKKEQTPMPQSQAEMVSNMLRSRKRSVDVPPVDAESDPITCKITTEPVIEEIVVEALPVEEAGLRKSKNKRTLSHKEMFVCEVGLTARYGKAVYIRREFHERIQKIVQSIGANEVTIYSYIDNVLSHHFNTYQQEITKEYDDSVGKLF